MPSCAFRSGPQSFRFGRRSEYSIRVAGDLASRRKAYRFVHDVYLEKGYASPNRSGMWLSIHHALPQTVTVIVEQNEAVVGSLTTVCDSKIGLPTDNIYHEELESLRRDGRRLAGITGLAVSDRARDPEVLYKLFNAAYLYAYHVAAHTDFEIITTTRHARFYQHFFGFAQLGGVKSDPRANGAVGCLNRLDLEEVARIRRERRWIDLPKGIKNMEVGRAEHELLNCMELGHQTMSLEELRSIFADESDVLVGASEEALRFLSCLYPDTNLTEGTAGSIRGLRAPCGA